MMIDSAIGLLTAIPPTSLGTERVVVRDGGVSGGTESLLQRGSGLADVDHFAVFHPEVEPRLVRQGRHLKLGERSFAVKMALSTWWQRCGKKAQGNCLNFPCVNEAIFGTR